MLMYTYCLHDGFATMTHAALYRLLWVSGMVFALENGHQHMRPHRNLLLQKMLQLPRTLCKHAVYLEMTNVTTTIKTATR